MSKRYAIVVALVIAFIASGVSIGVAWLRHAHALALDQKCINNLRIIDGAKQQWALEHFLAHVSDDANPNWCTNWIPYLNAVATEEDIHLYNSRNQYPMPRCPRGGIYTIGRVADAPTCSYPGHVLPEGNDPCFGFPEEVLKDALLERATEFVVKAAPKNGTNTQLRCRMGGAWRESWIPSDLRPRFIASLASMAGLPPTQFPMEGTFSMHVGVRHFSWTMRTPTSNAECVLTAKFESTDKYAADEEAFWKAFTSSVDFTVGQEARGEPPKFGKTWKDYWERRVSDLWLFDTDTALKRRIEYIRHRRLQAGLQDYELAP